MKPDPVEQIRLRLHAVDRDPIQAIRARLDEIERDGAPFPGTVRQIVERAAAITGMTEERITGPRRDRASAWVRQAVAYAASRNGPPKLSAIGRALGGRDHSTILYSIEQAEKRLPIDRAFSDLCALLEPPKLAGAGVAAFADEPIAGMADLFAPGPLFHREEGHC